MKEAVEIWQDNVLTVARYEMTEIEKNILYMVVAQIKPTDPESKYYQVSVNEIANIMGAGRPKAEYYRRATKKLMTRMFEATLHNGDILQATFIASAQFKKGTDIIEIELSRKVRPFYIDLNQRFTKIQLVAAISLNSAYAKRIYEILCMYKNMKNKKFKRNLLELKETLNIIDLNTGKDIYSNWTRFQKNVLNVAAKEINNHTDIMFTYKPIYGDRPGRGRKPVVEVEFEVFYQAKQEVVQVSSTHDRLMKQFKLRKDQADQVISVYSIESINKQLYDIQIKATDGKIKNLGSYTAKVFNLSNTTEQFNY